MQKNNKPTKKSSQNKIIYIIIAVLGVLLAMSIGIIAFLLFGEAPVGGKTPNTNQSVSSSNTSETINNPDKTSSSQQSNNATYDKNNPIIMITDRNTPVITSEKEGHLLQTAEVNMYCDLQDGYEISGTTGKAYKGDKLSTSQMDYESSQRYRKYSQYGSVALICTGHGSYRKSDKWKLSHHYLKIDYDNITEDGRFTFTEEAWLNPDGSTKEFRDFASKLVRIISTDSSTTTSILEDYQIKMHFVLNRGAQDFLNDWQKLIDTI